MISARRLRGGYEVRNRGRAMITNVRLSGGALLARELDAGESVVLHTSMSAGYVKYIDAERHQRRVSFRGW